MRRGHGEGLEAVRLNNLLCEDPGRSLVQRTTMLIQSAASSLAASSSSKVSISGTASSVNPRTTANVTMWNVWFKIAPSQLKENATPILLQFLCHVDRPVLRKNSIRLPTDRDAGTYLFGFTALESPRSQPRLARKHFSAGLTVCDPDSPCLDSFRTQSAHWILCLT